MGKEPLTTQQTSKRWKLLQLLGVLSVLASIAAFMLAVGLAEGRGSNSGMVAFSVIAFIVGCILYAVGRFMAWWNHG